MQLRASELIGTDLVALSVWPDDDTGDDTGDDIGDDAGDDAGGDARGMPVALPVETRCVDAALAAALEDLVERGGPVLRATPGEGEQQRAARAVLRWLIARAQHHHYRRSD